MSDQHNPKASLNPGIGDVRLTHDQYRPDIREA